ncbi:MAG TPA: hypothetical protein VFD30_12815 [Terriglobia bacterium]|nr:hypothetical protein [Terriglobia bacterium]
MRLMKLRYRVLLVTLVLTGILELGLLSPSGAQTRFPQGRRHDQPLDPTLQDQLRKLGLPQPGENEPGLNRNAAANRLMLRSRLEEMRRDSATLADLANSLKSDLDRTNENMLNLGTLEKADKIEKLARKIKKLTKSY